MVVVPLMVSPLRVLKLILPASILSIIHSSLSLSLSLSAAIIVHEDPIVFLPADSALYDFTLNEKQCPVCQHVFVTLTEKEFQSHVALCFK